MVFVEASTNFDLSDLPSFFKRVGRILEAGFSEREQWDVVSRAQRLELDEEMTLDYSAIYQGVSIPLRIAIFMDDVASPNVYFYTGDNLAQAIAAEMNKYSQERSG